MELSSLYIDTQAVNDGEWVSGLPGMGKLRLKVRGNLSKEVRELRSQKERAVVTDMRDNGGEIEPEVMRRIFRETLHEAVLLDWDNLLQNGEAVPYSAKLAKAICMDDAAVKFHGMVASAADYVDTIPGSIPDDLKALAAKN